MRTLAIVVSIVLSLAGTALAQMPHPHCCRTGPDAVCGPCPVETPAPNASMKRAAQPAPKAASDKSDAPESFCGPQGARVPCPAGAAPAKLEEKPPVKSMRKAAPPTCKGPHGATIPCPKPVEPTT